TASGSKPKSAGVLRKGCLSSRRNFPNMAHHPVRGARNRGALRVPAGEAVGLGPLQGLGAAVLGAAGGGRGLRFVGGRGGGRWRGRRGRSRVEPPFARLVDGTVEFVQNGPDLVDGPIRGTHGRLRPADDLLSV